MASNWAAYFCFWLSGRKVSMKNLVNSSQVRGASLAGLPSNKVSYQVLAMSFNLYNASSTALSLEHPNARNALKVPSKKLWESVELSEPVNFSDFNFRNSCKDTSLFHSCKSEQVPGIVAEAVQHCVDHPSPVYPVDRPSPLWLFAWKQIPQQYYPQEMMEVD